MNAQAVEFVGLEQVITERNTSAPGEKHSVCVIGERRIARAARARPAGQAGPRHAAGPAAPESQG